MMKIGPRRLFGAIAVTIVVVAAVLVFGPQPRFDFRIEAAPGEASTYIVKVTAINARARLWLRTRSHFDPYLKVYSNAAEQPLFGSYETDGDEVRFRPSVPLSPDASIYATFTAGGQSKVEFEPPESNSIIPEVLGIYPSSTVVPENLIKFYIEFSAAMTSGDFFRHAALINESTGKPVPGAFREVELWSPDSKRFTLWLHPGRQKTGVNLNEDEGPVLRSGGKYAVTISSDLTSTTGARLKASGTKSFTVGPHDNAVPNLKRWKLAIPASGTTVPLKVNFDEAMDWAMQTTALKVVGATGHPIEGRAKSLGDETAWLFTPAQPWTKGRYFLDVNPEFEDLAGNSFARAFESSPTDASSPSSPVVTRLDFEVK